MCKCDKGLISNLLRLHVYSVHLLFNLGCGDGFENMSVPFSVWFLMKNNSLNRNRREICSKT